jgi:hypothetical protein
MGKSGDLEHDVSEVESALSGSEAQPNPELTAVQDPAIGQEDSGYWWKFEMIDGLYACDFMCCGLRDAATVFYQEKRKKPLATAFSNKLNHTVVGP